MSSFLCFICHSTVNAETNEDMRDKYRDVVGMNLCLDSHLCYICCHVLNKLWMFKAVCLKRSLEYPVLFSEKGTINLQRNDTEIYTLCCDDACESHTNRNLGSKFYRCNHFEDSSADNSDKAPLNDYVQLHEDFEDFPKYNHDFKVETDIPADDCEESQDEPVDDSVESEDYAELKEQLIQDSEENNDGGIKHEEDPSNEVEHSDDDRVEEEAYLKAEEPPTKKSRSKKVERFQKIILSAEEQKAELEAKRKGKKYIEAQFKCANCALGFLFKDTYQAHMMRHEESNGEYRCSICTLRFANPAVLRAHLSLHSERHQCRRCCALVSRRRRPAHLEDCDGQGDRAACHLCGRVLKNSSGLQQHLKRFHRSDTSGRSYACNVCGKRYGDHAAVRTHMIKHIQRKFNCEDCSATFSSPYTLKQHRRRHTEAPELHVCVTCGTTYGSRKNLLAHHRNVHQKGSLPCPQCPRVCPNKRALSVHMSTHATVARPPRRTHHSGEAAVCHMCGASFKGKNKLNRHVREVCQKNRFEEQLTSYYEQENLP